VLIKDCLQCDFRSNASELKCAVHPSFKGMKCSDKELTITPKIRGCNIKVGLLRAQISLVALGEIVLVRGHYWDNFRFNTEGVQFVDDEGLGYAPDPVPSSLIRQKHCPVLPTLKEFLWERYPGQNVVLDGEEIQVLKGLPETKRSLERFSDITLYKGDNLVGWLDVPENKKTSIIQMWEMQSPEHNVFWAEEDEDVLY
jgi:hypothetical protein